MNYNIAEFERQLLFTTVPIWAEGRGSGAYNASTGVIIALPAHGGADLSLKSMSDTALVPFIVANAHSVQNAKSILIEFTEGDSERPSSRRATIEVSGDVLQQFADYTSDLAAIPAAPLIAQFEEAGRPLFFRSITTHITPSEEAWSTFGAFEDVIVIGCPQFVARQPTRGPIALRGITATPLSTDHEDRREFLVDVGEVPGISGSAVFRRAPRPFGGTGSQYLTFVGLLIEGMFTPGLHLSKVSRVLKSDVVFHFLRSAIARGLAEGGHLTAARN